MNVFPRLLLITGLLAAAPAAVAEEAYYCVPLEKLSITEGSLPKAGESPSNRLTWRRLDLVSPYASLDGPGEIYLGLRPEGRVDGVDRVCVRSPEKKEITGRLFLRDASLVKLTPVRFRIPASAADPDTRKTFYELKSNHYARLLNRAVPGAAWFRHEKRAAEAAQGKRAPTPGQAAQQGQRIAPDFLLARSYALFSGGRAVSENLQLDRDLPATMPGDTTEKVKDLGGISVPEINWEPLIKGRTPQLDPLARSIPADQHVVFFPSFAAAIAVSEESDRQGVPLLQLAEPRSESALVRQRYERQLCLSLTGLSRLLGPHVVKSMALTGGDSYFRTGTDIAVLFEPARAGLLEPLLLAQVTLGAGRDATTKAEEGKVAGVAYRGFRSPDRRVCSYVARLGDAVVVTNSLAQLARLADVQAGREKNLAALPEYRFFRDRYRRGDPEETALVFLSDATIRRWCGPRWRIATSRRTRDAAVLAELQAASLPGLVSGKVAAGPLYTDLPLASESETFVVDRRGVRSSVQNTLEFLTPIIEMPLAHCSVQEAGAYRRWREGYQRNWRWAFDPIALRLTVERDRLSGDLTVMPLIWNTEYRDLLGLSLGAKFSPQAGGPHATLGQVILALNTKGAMFQTAGNYLAQMSKGIALGWVGSWATVYVEDDPVWAELAKLSAEKREEFFEKTFPRLPIGVEIEAGSPLRLTGFLTGVRAFIEQTVPGMTQWEALSHGEEPYVKVSATERARTAMRDLPADKLALCYAARGDRLILTLHEGVLKRALDRHATGRRKATAGKPPEKPAPPDWLGSNLAARVESKLVQSIAGLAADDYQVAMQRRAWANLPILNQWHRRFPNEDPVALHERVWHLRLLCPGGGRYQWNERWQTMESTVYGHPGEPKEGPAVPPAVLQFARGAFGLTFENQGLRARVSLQR